MDSEFWIKSWKEGRTNFNQAKVHEKLVKYFPPLRPQKGQKVLVPLCGKSIDMLWLLEQGLEVHGVELYEQAVKDFFAEHSPSPPKMILDPDFIRHTGPHLNLSCGDFFKFRAVNEYDFIYDRAALVALPPAMRKDYAGVIKRSLKKGGKCLLIVYHYDASKMEGPPFSIEDSEVHELYGDQFSIQLLESEKPVSEGSRLSGVESMKQNVYLLEKKEKAS